MNGSQHSKRRIEFVSVLRYQDLKNYKPPRDNTSILFGKGQNGKTNEVGVAMTPRETLPLLDLTHIKSFFGYLVKTWRYG